MREKEEQWGKNITKNYLQKITIAKFNIDSFKDKNLEN